MLRIGASAFLFLSAFFCLSAQEWGNHPYVLRGEVFVDMEPIYAGHIDPEYPLDIPTAASRALEEAAFLYSAMIYGWSFNYIAGERARRLDEVLEINPVSLIQFGDPGLRVTDTEIEDSRLIVWTDYHLTDAQQNRFQVWRSGMIRNAQGLGYGPSRLDEYPGWFDVKKLALRDAARSALRAALQGSERNRPREVTGFISLASFPRFFIDAGRWAAAARFRIQIVEIIPFPVY